MALEKGIAERVNDVIAAGRRSVRDAIRDAIRDVA